MKQAQQSSTHWRGMRESWKLCCRKFGTLFQNAEQSGFGPCLTQPQAIKAAQTWFLLPVYARK